MKEEKQETGTMTGEHRDIPAKEETGDRKFNPVRHRASGNSYLSFMLVATFFVGLLLHLELDLYAFVLFLWTWVVTPLLMLSDKIAFDGSELRRTGLVPRSWSLINGGSSRIEISRIELVETQALRALRRGGDIVYKYRTLIMGGEMRLTLVSRGDSYRELVVPLLSRLPEEVLDTRSAEIRDYLRDPKEVETKVRFAKIPSNSVLESTIRSSGSGNRRKDAAALEDPAPNEVTERVSFLRQLANELRLSGNLVQALEVFRRALRLESGNAWMLFEFARCLHSYASAERDESMERRAIAALRLAEKRAGQDERLLSRVGECYFQYGEWNRARKVFQRTIEFAEDSYRSVRGMAELSLREGKIAHVIHHFAVANRLAESPALRRWTSSEAAYFDKLNSDDEYMDMELSRVSMLESLERGRKTSLRVVVLGLPCIITGMILDNGFLVNAGWTVSGVALLVWSGVVVSVNMLSSRLPIETE